MEHIGFVPAITLVFSSVPTFLVLIVGLSMKVAFKELIRVFVIPTVFACVIIGLVASSAAFSMAGHITERTDDPRIHGVDRITDINFIRDHQSGKETLVLTLGPAENELLYTEDVKDRYPNDAISPGQYQLLDSVEYSIYQTRTIQLFGPAQAGEPEVVINQIIDEPSV